MKYIRKVTALVLAIIFCAAIVIGLGVIYSVRNVNVEFIGYSGMYEEEFGKTKENLNKLKGTGMLFLSDGDVQNKVSDDSVLAVASYERIYPCTVNVVVKERVECFVSLSGDVAYVYDEDGEFMRSSRLNGDYLNPYDGSPDVVVRGEISDTLSAEEYKNVGNLLKSFKTSFGVLRKLVDVVTVYSSLSSANIALRSGVSILVYEWEQNVAEKIAAVYGCYCALSDGERTDKNGKITVADSAGGAHPVASYEVLR